MIRDGRARELDAGGKKFCLVSHSFPNACDERFPISGEIGRILERHYIYDFLGKKIALVQVRSIIESGEKRSNAVYAEIYDPNIPDLVVSKASFKNGEELDQILNLLLEEYLKH